uniref:Uncharacterized protein n=1 Tax=Glycine max TaxID=3847 RepID=C6T7B2_SOYBN|nr:unknown [Glycine max]
MAGGKYMQMVHCIKSGVCRTVSLPHNCLSPPCTLTLTDWRHYQYKMECEDGRIHSALLLPTFCSSTVCYFCWGEFKSSSSSSCTYPLLSTLLLGLFALILTSYLFWLGSRILKLVINKGLQKRVYTLVLSVSGFLPLRVVFLGLSVLSGPEDFMFEAFAFLAFLALASCAGVCMCMLVYRPLADCLALDINDTTSLIKGDRDATFLQLSLFSPTPNRFLSFLVK